MKANLGSYETFRVGMYGKRGVGEETHRDCVFLNSQKLLFRLPALQTKVIAPWHEKGLRGVGANAAQPVAVSDPALPEGHD